MAARIGVCRYTDCTRLAACSSPLFVTTFHAFSREFSRLRIADSFRLRGRDAGYPAPPEQFPASGTTDAVCHDILDFLREFSPLGAYAGLTKKVLEGCPLC